MRRLPARRDVRGGAVPRRSAPTRRAGPWCTSAACGVPYKLPCAARRVEAIRMPAARGGARRYGRRNTGVGIPLRSRAR
ncbi:hypothetical protein BURPSS13_C0057 [Burkholderia pseudomallei S13]|nr:hypothetical protein BURPSS13_C0057 [Burkholderia pseudomallei S13]